MFFLLLELHTYVQQYNLIIVSDTKHVFNIKCLYYVCFQSDMFPIIGSLNLIIFYSRIMLDAEKFMFPKAS